MVLAKSGSQEMIWEAFNMKKTLMKKKESKMTMKTMMRI